MAKITPEQQKQISAAEQILKSEGWVVDQDERSMSIGEFWQHELCPGLLIIQGGARGKFLTWYLCRDDGKQTSIMSDTDINKVIGAAYDEAAANHKDVEDDLGVVIEAKKQEVYKWEKAPSKADLAIVKSFGFTPAEGGDVGGDPLLWANEKDHYGLMLHWLDQKGMWMAELNDMSQHGIPAQEMEQDGIPTKEFLQGAIDLHNELLDGTDDTEENELVGDKAVIDALIKAGYPSYGTIKGGGADLINTAYVMGKVTAGDELNGYEICIDSIEDDSYSVYALNRKDPAGWIFVNFTHGVEDRPEHAVSIGERIMKNGITAEPIKSITQGDQQLENVPSIMDSKTKTNISEAPKFETHIRYLSYIQRRDGKEFPDDTWTGVVGTTVQAGRMRDDRHIFYRPIGSDDKFTLFYDIDEIEEADSPPSLADVQRIKRQKHLAQLAAAARGRVEENTMKPTAGKTSLCEGIKRRMGMIK